MRSVTILTLAIVLSLLAIPLSSATTMQATINTQTNVATVNTTSNYVLYYTYPADSNTSKELNGTVAWLNATSYVNGTTRQEIQQDMNRAEVNSTASTNGSNSSSATSVNASTSSNQTVIHVVNATITYHVHAFANQTNLTVYRNMTLHMTITNVTKKTAGNSTVIDMSWRAFGVQGRLESTFHGMLAVRVPFLNTTVNAEITTTMDVNELGDMSLGFDIGGAGNLDMSGFFQQDGFSGDLAAYSTVNFHVFGQPLSSWVKVYDGNTNSTTFYYNKSSTYAVNSTTNDSGSIYTLKLRIDPHGALTTNGYAKVTSANELAVMSVPPSGLSGATVALVSVVVVLALIGAISYAVRKNRPKK
jgi:hypothetical protein